MIWPHPGSDTPSRLMLRTETVNKLSKITLDNIKIFWENIGEWNDVDSPSDSNEERKK
jgi:hypothetical protein